MAAQGKNRVFVVGVGMTPFVKPGGDKDYPELAKEAIVQALADASVPYDVVQQACVGYCYGDSTCGQRALYPVGLSGIPIYNVNNNCSTGSTALFMAKQFVEGGLSDCVLALGFEKMEKGSLGSKYQDRTNPLDQHVGTMVELRGMQNVPPAPQLFGNAGKEHMEKYGTTLEHFAKVAAKNHKHSVKNPRSQFRAGYSVEQILKSPKVIEPLTKLQCCPTSDGAAAALLVSERFVHQYGLYDRAVEIVGMSMVTDMKSTFDDKSMMKVVGYDMSKKAAEEAYAQAGVTPNDLQVVELHDCFSANELITYEALGLCKVGEAGKFIDAGDNTYGGKYVVNPSGGLISKGHPLGATGLAQCFELCSQLRGLCGERQVPGVKIALQHNLGLGGAAVVTIYKRAAFALPGKRVPGNSTVGTAPAVLAAPVAAPVVAAAASPSASSSGFQATAVFAQLAKRIETEKELVKKVGVVYRFDLTADGKTKSWLVDLKNGAGSIKESDASAKADCILMMKDSDFVLLMAGKMQAQSAFMKGQLKIKGNMMLAQKLDVVVKSSPAAAAPTPAASAPAASAPAASAGSFQATAIFAQLAKRIETEKELVKKVGVVYRFDLTADGKTKSWLVDLKNGAGAIKESDASAKADCMIAMKDSDFVLLMAGKMQAQSAFMKGQLKIKGNMMLAQKLDVLVKPKAAL